MFAPNITAQTHAAAIDGIMRARLARVVVDDFAEAFLRALDQSPTPELVLVGLACADLASAVEDSHANDTLRAATLPLLKQGVAGPAGTLDDYISAADAAVLLRREPLTAGGQHFAGVDALADFATAALFTCAETYGDPYAFLTALASRLRDGSDTEQAAVNLVGALLSVARSDYLLAGPVASAIDQFIASECSAPTLDDHQAPEVQSVLEDGGTVSVRTLSVLGVAHQFSLTLEESLMLLAHVTEQFRSL